MLTELLPTRLMTVCQPELRSDPPATNLQAASLSRLRLESRNSKDHRGPPPASRQAQPAPAQRTDQAPAPAAPAISSVVRRRHRTITVVNARKFARYYGGSTDDQERDALIRSRGSCRGQTA